MTSQGAGSEVPKVVWSESTLHTYIDICIRVFQKMGKPHTHFNKRGWDIVINEFRKETGLDYGQKELKRKWDALEYDYTSWKDLMGWGKHKKNAGTDEAWWAERIKGDPRAEKIRKKGFDPQLEKKLDVMFHKIVATGEFAMSPGYNMNITSQEPHADAESCNYSGEDSNSCEDSEEDSISYEDAQRIGILIEKLVDAIEAGSYTVTPRVAEPEGPRMRDLVRDLMNIPGLDTHSDLFMFGTELFEEKLKREVYVQLRSPTQKLNWLNYHFISKGRNKKI